MKSGTRILSGAACVAALVGCAWQPREDLGLSALIGRLAPQVAAQLRLDPRPVRAFYNDGHFPGIEGCIVVGSDWLGRVTERWICVEREDDVRALRMLLLHELVHAHVVDWDLSLFEGEGLACLVSLASDPTYAARALSLWEPALARCRLSVERARRMSLPEFQALGEDEKLSFYLLAYRDAVLRWGHEPWRARPSRPAAMAEVARRRGPRTGPERRDP